MHGYGKEGVSGVIAPVQTLCLTLVTLFVEPMLYQAFLQIGTNFCYPFGHERHHVPIAHMIEDLSMILHQACFVVDSHTTGKVIMSPRERFSDEISEESK